MTASEGVWFSSKSRQQLVFNKRQDFGIGKSLSFQTCTKFCLHSST